MSDATSAYLNNPTRSLESLRAAIVKNILWHERALPSGFNTPWHEEQLAHRRRALADLDAALRARQDRRQPASPE